VTLPERRYDLAARLMARAIDNAIAGTTTVTNALNEAAADWGRTVGDQARADAGPRPGRERLLTTTCEALTEYGYEPHRVGDAIVLRNCPFDTLAREHTQLVCGTNLTMLAAVTDRISRTGLAARLEPAPDRCCVVLDVAVDEK
jgi:predicted ArsR family transcriptional regulator